MKQSSYNEPDYAFGKFMLTLRTAIGLTQAGLAEHLEISRHAVGGWEIGQTYPKADHLKRFIALCVQQQAFVVGREDEEIRALWQAAHQKVLLNEAWLQELLSRWVSSPLDVGAEQPQPVFSQERALWTVPFARNPHFTGRDELLDGLMQSLSPPKVGQPIAMRRAALTQAKVIKGLGGIGKTQIAVEYAYRVREQGHVTHVFWITASSEEALLMSFAALADVLPHFTSRGETDQRKLVAEVLRWLEQCPQPWLLILDNADDLAMAQPFLPLRGNGSILLTTRASAVSWLASSVEVDTMGMLEGIELVLRRAQRFDDATDDEINEAGNLVVALAHFPLALDQAGAYIEETRCSLHDYLQLYQQHRHTLLARRGRQATQYPAPVATTWSLSLQHVKQTNPAAADLLHLCAFLAPDRIPEELLIEGASHWPPALQQAVADRFSFNQMLETLLAFSLVKRLPEDRLLSLHRLVQVVQQESLSLKERRQWAERLVRAMNALFPQEPHEVTTWQACQRLLEQVHSCNQLIQEHQLLFPDAAELLDRTGVYLRERALYSLAEPLSQQALHLWEQIEQPERLGTARSLNNRARLLYWQGQYGQAELLHRRALAIREQHLGTDHLDVAECLHDLAGLYRVQEKYVQAELLYVQALHIREQQLGPEHLLVAETLNGLAALYQNQGKYTLAEPLNQRTLRIREQRLGPEHLLVAESLNDLAVLYESMQEQYTQVEVLSLRALHIWEQQLGVDHPMVAYPLLLLALFYRQQGKYAQAEPLYVRALHLREQQLGGEHRKLINPLNGLAALYREQRKFAEAESLSLRALHISEQQWGPEHSLVANSLNGLAALYRMQGKFTEAESLSLRALHIRKQLFGSEHRDVAQSLNGLANLYTQQGEYAQATPLYVQALHIIEQQVGPEHLETAGVLHDFAGFQHMQGKPQEAVVLYQRALLIRENVLGADHPRTIDTRKHLHEVLVVLSQSEEATEEKR